MKILCLTNHLDPARQHFEGFQDILLHGLSQMPEVTLLAEFPYVPSHHGILGLNEDHYRPNFIFDAPNLVVLPELVGLDQFDYILVSHQIELLPWIQKVIEGSREKIVYLDGKNSGYIYSWAYQHAKTYVFEERIIREKFLDPAFEYDRRYPDRSYGEVYGVSPQAEPWYDDKGVPFYPPGVTHINLAQIPNTALGFQFPEHVRDIDIVFTGTIFNGQMCLQVVRRKVLGVLLEYVREKHLEAILTKVGNYRTFAANLSRAKVVVCVEGSGFDTPRRYEAPYYGAATVSHELPIEVDNDFVDKQSTVLFKNAADLPRALDYALDHWEELARRGQEHLQRYHMSTNRAEKLMSVLR